MLDQQNCLPHRYTVEEYLTLEETSEVRPEFYNGEVYARAGRTVNHNRLTRRVATLLENQASRNQCEVFSENMKVDVRTGGQASYPDVVVSCHPFDLRGNNLILRQPRLIADVLSKATVLKDRGAKWRGYRKISSLWYYMLVDQYSMNIELSSQIEETDEWINTLYEQQEDVIVLSRMNLELTVGGSCEGIELLPETDEPSAGERTE